MKFTLLFLFSAIALTTCEDNSSEKPNGTVLFVNSLKVDCTGVGKMKCLQIQEADTLTPNNWENFYGNIEGFEYEPGFIYKLLVKKKKLDPAKVPADASTLKYSLIRVTEKNRDNKLQLNDIWALETIDGETIDLKNLSGRQERPVLEIHLNKMRISGNDGCNAMFGTIAKLDEKRISFTHLGGTLMACPNMELPDKYNNALGKTKTYKRNGLNLYFYDSEGNEVLRFKKVD
jgi:heat shock protein HslJ